MTEASVSVTDHSFLGVTEPAELVALARAKRYFVQSDLEAAYAIVVEALGPLTIADTWRAIREQFPDEYAGLDRRNVELARDRLVDILGELERLPGPIGRGARYRLKAMRRRCETQSDGDVVMAMRPGDVAPYIAVVTSPSHIAFTSPSVSSPTAPPRDTRTRSRADGDVVAVARTSMGTSMDKGPLPCKGREGRARWKPESSAMAARADRLFRELVLADPENTSRHADEQIENVRSFSLDSVRVFLNNIRIRIAKGRPPNSPGRFFWARMKKPAHFGGVEDGSLASFEEVDRLIERLRGTPWPRERRAAGEAAIVELGGIFASPSQAATSKAAEGPARPTKDEIAAGLRGFLESL